MRRLQISSG